MNDFFGFLATPGVGLVLILFIVGVLGGVVLLEGGPAQVGVIGLVVGFGGAVALLIRG